MKNKELHNEEKLQVIDSETVSTETYSFKFNEIKWRNVILITAMHLLAIYAQYLYITGHIKWQNAFFGYVIGAMSALGITMGAHRLWSHRSYKAKWPLRVHHKYSETNKDPHNSNRGFFFAHVGWLMLKKHPDVIEAGRKIDLSDLLADPIVRFQRRYYLPLSLLCWALIPTYTSVYLFNEKPLNAFLYCVIFRYVYVINATWSVNSSAHSFGYRPYNVNINPRENKTVTYISLGEGYHNYHHAFPFDYSASEFGTLTNFNVSTALIDFFAAIGWAYDLKKPKLETIKAKMDNSGDKTHLKYRNWMHSIADWIIGAFVSIFGLIVFGLSMRILVMGGLYNIE